MSNMDCLTVCCSCFHRYIIQRLNLHFDDFMNINLKICLISSPEYSHSSHDDSVELLPASGHRLIFHFES